jgi:hypothetical protein
VLINLTVCTLKGPGRAVDIWIDEESRKVASAMQLETHKLFQREHGLACWVDEVDNKESLVTITMFDGNDPSLLKDMPVKSSIAAVVGEDSLRTYDQINDSQRGPIQEILSVPVVPVAPGSEDRAEFSTDPRAGGGEKEKPSPFAALVQLKKN